jgi:hypothetical protein
MDVRTGYDYHLAEVHRSVRAEGGTRAYFAACVACGWRGPQRSTAHAADDDASAHDNASNPPSNR